jgi:hypothetical protein
MTTKIRKTTQTIAINSRLNNFIYRNQRMRFASMGTSTPYSAGMMRVVSSLAGLGAGMRAL